MQERGLETSLLQTGHSITAAGWRSRMSSWLASKGVRPV